MGFSSFEIIKEEYIALGDEYFCRTTLKAKEDKASAMRASELQFNLAKVVTISPYVYCKKLPDFASITDESRTDKDAQAILMTYTDGSEEITIRLYGNKRARIYDQKRKISYKGNVTEVY